jgi:hypothetical protein
VSINRYFKHFLAVLKIFVQWDRPLGANEIVLLRRIRMHIDAILETWEGGVR